MKKKTLFITGYFPFRQGGAEYQALLLAEELKRDMQVSFIFRNHWNKPQITEDNGFGLYGIIPKRIPGSSGSFIFEIPQLWQIIKKIKPDIIYVRGTNAYFFCAALYARKYRCRLLWHIAHDAEASPISRDTLMKRPFKVIDKSAVGFGIKNCTTIVGQTYHQADLLKKNYRRSCQAIVENWHPLPTLPRLLVKKKKICQVLWIANWRPFKQPEKFINLVHTLADLTHIRFIMLGRNQEFPAIREKAAAAGIEIPGEISNEAVNQLLDRSHLLINTSLMEGFSNTFIQAWMREVPVISLHADPDNVLSRQKIGICSGSFSQLMRDVRYLTTHETVREEMGRRARQYAIRHNSLTNIQRMKPFF